MSRQGSLCIVLTAGVVSLLSKAPFATAADWPQWRGPTRDGVSREEVSASHWSEKGPPLVWAVQVGTGFSSVAVSEGRAYTMGNRRGKDVVTCVDAKRGKMLWKHEYACDLGDDLHEGGPGATPTVHDGRVYTISKWGHVFCLNARSGAVEWRRNLKTEEGVKPNEWGLAGSALIYKDLVLFNAASAGIALHGKTGKTIWRNGKGTAGYASPLLFRPAGQAESVLIFAAKALVAVNPTDGRELWRHPWKTGYDNNNADPIVLDDQVFITSYDRGGTCLKVSGGKVDVQYKERVINTHMAPPVRVGEHLYGFSGHHGRRPNFRCVHIPSGKVRWIERDFPVGSIMLAGRQLLILDGKGTLVLAEPDPKAFKEIARARILEGRCWTPPALADGLIYVRNSRGLLRCYRLQPVKKP